MCGKQPGNVDELNSQVRVLADPVRRTVIRHFAANPAGTTLDGLVESVIADRVGKADEAARQELTLSLHHAHLPKLEAVGLLTYEEESRRIEPTTHTSEGSQVWRAVTAIDGVVTLIENDARPEIDNADTKISAD